MPRPKALAEGETEAFRSDYPTRLNFPYRLEDKAIEWPFLVEGMWNDGQPTFARTPRRRPRCTKKRTGNRPWLPTILKKTACISPVMFRQRLVADRQRKSQVAVHRAGGGTVSSGWKRLYPKPAGSLPGGIVTQWGVALIT